MCDDDDDDDDFMQKMYRWVLQPWQLELEHFRILKARLDWQDPQGMLKINRCVIYGRASPGRIPCVMVTQCLVDLNRILVHLSPQYGALGWVRKQQSHSITEQNDSLRNCLKNVVPGHSVFTIRTGFDHEPSYPSNWKKCCVFYLDRLFSKYCVVMDIWTKK